MFKVARRVTGVWAGMRELAILAFGQGTTTGHTLNRIFILVSK